jgi:hypothetical protein
MFTYFPVHVHFSFETIHYLHTLSYKSRQSHANNRRLEDEPFDEVTLHDPTRRTWILAGSTSTKVILLYYSIR